MRRVAAILPLVLLLSSGAAAQVRYGAKAGVTFATIDAPEQPDYELRFGLAAGGFVVWPIGSRFAFQPEVLFNQKGAKIDSDLVEASIRFDYLEVPLLARYNLTSSAQPFFLVGGPSLAFRLHAEASALLGEESESIDITDDTEELDWGLVVGAGKEFSRFSVEGRYTHGFKDVDPDGANIKNRAITVLAGVRF